ncbi:MAG: hypothetical protein JJE13_08990 [Thermoleophilia bacterium]|nr:hypothetical protein [Thermoleophilia bacterium]
MSINANQTSGVDLLLAAFVVLTPGEQEIALRRCQSIWLIEQEGENSQIKKMLASLNRVAEVLGVKAG